MSEGEHKHLQTETNPSIAPQGAIKSGYGLKYGCLVTPDGQISTLRVRHVRCPPKMHRHQTHSETKYEAESKEKKNCASIISSA